MKFERHLSAGSRRIFKVILISGLLYGAYQFLKGWDTWESVNPESIVNYLNTWGSVGPLVYMGMMATAVIVSPIPSLPLDLAAGVAYGPILGTVYSVVGAEVGAIISFLIGRFLGRDVVDRLLKGRVVFCEKCTDRHLVGLVFLSRLLPIFSFDLISYGAGLTNMSLKAFALATFLGMIPPTLALTYLGSRVMSLSWFLILTGGGLILVFLYLPKWIMSSPTAGWARLIQGDRPNTAGKGEENQLPEKKSLTQCSWCRVKSKK